jgi:hypothetical protein
VADVEVSRGIGKHVEAVVLRSRGIEIGPEEPGNFPAIEPFGLEGPEGKNPLVVEETLSLCLVLHPKTPRSVHTARAE